MRRGFRLVAAAAMLAAGGCMERPHYAGSFDLPGDAGGRTLTVTGTGAVVLPPTRIEFDCVLTTDADTPARAWMDAGHRLTRLMLALQEQGVPQTELAPRAASLHTRLDGWRVTQHLQVGLDDLPHMQALLEAAMGPGGANDVTNVRSGHRHPRGATDRARERALVNARDTAEMLAGQLSLRLGEVLSVEALPADETASGTAVGEPPAAGDVRAPSVAADALEVSAQLRVTWRLEP